MKNSQVGAVHFGIRNGAVDEGAGRKGPEPVPRGDSSASMTQSEPNAHTSENIRSIGKLPVKHPEHLKATRGDFKARSRLGQATRGPFSWPVAFSLSRCFSALGPKCLLPSVASLVGRCRPFFSRTLRLYCAYSLLLQACRSRLFLLSSAHVAYSQTRLRATAAALESRVHRTQCKLLLSQDQGVPFAPHPLSASK